MLYHLEVRVPRPCYVLLRRSNAGITVDHIEGDISPAVDTALYPSDDLASDSIILFNLKVVRGRAISVRGEYKVSRDS